MIKSVILMISFLILFLFIVGILHYYIYFSLAKFFAIKKVWLKISIISLLIILPISFIFFSEKAEEVNSGNRMTGGVEIRISVAFLGEISIIEDELVG